MSPDCSARHEGPARERERLVGIASEGGEARAHPEQVGAHAGIVGVAEQRLGPVEPAAGDRGSAALELDLGEGHRRPSRPKRIAGGLVGGDGAGKERQGEHGPTAALDGQRPEVDVLGRQPLGRNRLEPRAGAGPVAGPDAPARLGVVASLSERRILRRAEIRVDAEAVAMADEAADRPLHSPGSQRPAREADRALKRGFGDGEIRPERVHQLVLRHHPPGVADEVGEEVEDQRLHLLRLAAHREAAGFLVELEGAEGRGQGRHRAAGAGNDKRKIGRR